MEWKDVPVEKDDDDDTKALKRFAFQDAAALIEAGGSSERLAAALAFRPRLARETEQEGVLATEDGGLGAAIRQNDENDDDDDDQRRVIIEPTKKTKMTLLHLAAAADRADCVAVILECPACMVGARNSTFQNAAHTASQYGHSECAWLISEGIREARGELAFPTGRGTDNAALF